MALTGFGLKSAALVATLLLLGACETPGEEKADTSGGGGSAVTTTTTQDKAPAMAKDEGAATGSQEDLVLNVGDRVFFEYDSSELQAPAREQIERWAGWLKQYPANTVTIEGHCDERGTREYNLGLGERRADSVRRYLIQLGISSDRVANISFGKERPVCVTSEEGCWSQNRRGVMVIN